MVASARNSLSFSSLSLDHASGGVVLSPPAYPAGSFSLARMAPVAGQALPREPAYSAIHRTFSIRRPNSFSLLACLSRYRQCHTREQR